MLHGAKIHRVMQMQLPFFPSDTKLINATLGFKCKDDDMVYYLHNGSPIFCHDKSDLNSYRYILGNLVEMNLCSCGELSKALGIPIRTVQRYAKTFREKGSDWFFHREEKRGSCHKLDEQAMERIQQMLDEFIPVAQIARELKVTEGAIRYHIRTGKLKKK